MQLFIGHIKHLIFFQFIVRVKLWHLLCDCWPFLILTTMLVFLVEVIRMESNMDVLQDGEQISMVQLVTKLVLVFNFEKKTVKLRIH